MDVFSSPSIHSLFKRSSDYLQDNISNKTDCNTYTPPEWHIQEHSVVTTMLSSFASIIGSLLIVATFVIWRDLRTYARTILVFLAIADFFTGLGYIFGSAVYIHYELLQNYSNSSNYEHLCTAQSFITTYFPISSFLWTANLAVYLFVAIVMRKVKLAKKLMILFHITAWGIPMVVCIAAVSADKFGSATSRSSGSWCWVKFNSHLEPNASVNEVLVDFYGIEFLCGKFWEIMTYFVALVLCSSIKATLASRKKEGLTEGIKYGSLNMEKKMQAAILQLDQKLIWIPFTFLFLRMWGNIRFFITFGSSCHERVCDYIVVGESCSKILYNPWLVYLQSICDPGQGWSNALLFVVFQPKIAQRLCPCVFVAFKRLTSCLLKRCRRKPSRPSVNSGANRRVGDNVKTPFAGIIVPDGKRYQERSSGISDQEPLILNESLKSNGSSVLYHSTDKIWTAFSTSSGSSLSRVVLPESASVYSQNIQGK